MKVWSNLPKNTHTRNVKLQRINLICASKELLALSSIKKLNETDIKNSKFLLFLNLLIEII